MPTIITRGAMTARGYGFGASAATAATYIEDVFSTYLYTGNGSSQTISNGIDLSTYGGMTWLKSRSNADNHGTYDTARGVGNYLLPNLTTAQGSANGVSAFNTTGFTLGSVFNDSAKTYVSWTFRKQAKFFDVVTYTGDGSASPRQIAHSLGSVPGFIVIKRTDTTSDWTVWHRSVTGNAFLQTSDAWQTGYTRITTPDASTFTVGASTAVNASGGTYVAYLFAHDAGGFGTSGADNVISCGSFTTDGSGNATVSLGYEPQFVLIKSTSFVDSWYLIDVMRGMSQKTTNTLLANTSGAESAYSSGYLAPTATGFTTPVAGLFTASQSFIYIAIRRGPMKTPTSGTSVFSPIASSAATGTALTTGFPVDAQIFSGRSTSATKQVFDRLRGVSSTTTESGIRLITSSTAAETAVSNTRLWDNTGFQMPSFFGGISMVFWNFGRAPGFFDVVCYTGTGASATLNHNLGVAPNMVIIKGRSVVSNWETYLSSLGGTGGNGLAINDSGAKSGTPPVSSATATTFTLNNGVSTSSGQTYVAYLFATLTGVSKVGSYTGTGTTKQIDCGFTGGARFVLIKRTDSTGDWYVWDSARGIVAGNDPYLLLNDTAAEVTGTDYVDTYSAGFEISSTAPAAINANGGSFIFLAIA